jgi:hypothetical protein
MSHVIDEAYSEVAIVLWVNEITSSETIRDEMQAIFTVNFANLTASEGFKDDVAFPFPTASREE